MKVIFFLFGLLVVFSVQSLAVSENYYFTGSGGSGDGFTSDDLALNYDGSQATYTASADGDTATYTIQLANETTINTNTMTLSLHCDKDSAQGGDQTKFDWVVYDCGTSSTCASTEATLCTGGTQLDCDNGVGTPAEETGTCSPGASGTIEANEYLGIVLTASKNKNPNPRAYYDTATYDSYIQMDITEAAPNGVPNWTSNLADSPDPVNITQNITYSATGDDPDGDAYSLTVCRTDSITDGYPGSCAASQHLCNISGVSDNVATNCNYTVVQSDFDTTITAYGFLCDSNSECNSTSTSVTTLVTENKSGLVSEVPATLPFYTNRSNPATKANYSCLGAMDAGDKCNVTWYVNATGTLDTTHSFFAYVVGQFNSTEVNSTTLRLSIVAAAGAAWDHVINGVSSAARINGVLRSSIVRVNGVS